MVCPSPLAEGRELKLNQRADEWLDWEKSPLAEGQELKSLRQQTRRRSRWSPLAEGRELKFYESWDEMLEDAGRPSRRGGN